MKKWNRLLAGFMAAVMVVLNVLTGATTAWAAGSVLTPSNAGRETAPELDPGSLAGPDERGGVLRLK